MNSVFLFTMILQILNAAPRIHSEFETHERGLGTVNLLAVEVENPEPVYLPLQLDLSVTCLGDKRPQRMIVREPICDFTYNFDKKTKVLTMHIFKTKVSEDEVRKLGASTAHCNTEYVHTINLQRCRD